MATFSSVLMSERLDNMINGGLQREAHEIVRTYAIIVLNIAEGLAPVDTGRLQASLVPGADENIFKLEPQGVIAIIGTLVFYAVFVEYGTRHMAPQPFLIPAIELVRPQFEQAIGKIFEGAGKAS